MLNIFNLFLFLFASWMIFTILNNQLSWLYVFLGVISSTLVSIISYRLKLIEEKSELLYLSIGFYRHFLSLYFKNFFSQIGLIFSLAFSHKEVKSVIYIISIDYKNQFNPALLATSINMTTGLFCVLVKDNNFFIHMIEESFFQNLDLKKTIKILKNVNDDNLI
jgi:multisubunit Na+/H+ antiporter MnhE subunit